jgi:hypothetical protein
MRTNLRDLRARVAQSKGARAGRWLRKRVDHAQAVAFVSLMGAVPAASAQAFQDFEEEVRGLAEGPFGIGLSILAIVIGAVFALGQMSVWPAMIGLGLAAVISLGPTFVDMIFDAFAG